MTTRKIYKNTLFLSKPVSASSPFLKKAVKTVKMVYIMKIKGKKIFKILDFEVKIDPSWIIIALLITWSLASGLFPSYYEGLSSSTYWLMGIAGAVLLFASLIAHELTHSLVARRFGMPMHGITLFIFGGVAEMGEEPPSSKAEFYMALSGPLISVFIGLIFHIALIFGGDFLPAPVEGVMSYLRWINWVLAAFNLIPAFPLDGGRVLRAILWTYKKDLRWSTKIATFIGSAFGLLLSILGVFYLILGAFIGGIWWILIGMFIRNASKMSYDRVIMKSSLSGKSVAYFMNQNTVTVEPGITIYNLVYDYIYRYHFKMFPVVEDGYLKGCISTKEVKKIPRDDWGSQKVEDFTEPTSPENTVPPHTDAGRVLMMMKQKNKSRLMVAESGVILGIITLKDMLRHISLKSDLEG